MRFSKSLLFLFTLLLGMGLFPTVASAMEMVPDFASLSTADISDTRELQHPDMDPDNDCTQCSFVLFQPTFFHQTTRPYPETFSDFTQSATARGPPGVTL